MLICIACGMAGYEGGESVTDVFEQTDRRVVENENSLKAGGE